MAVLPNTWPSVCEEFITSNYSSAHWLMFAKSPQHHLANAQAARRRSTSSVPSAPATKCDHCKWARNHSFIPWTCDRAHNNKNNSESMPTIVASYIGLTTMQDAASLRSSLQGEKSTGDIHLQFVRGNQYSGGGYEVVSFQGRERWCSISIFQSGNMVPAFVWQCLHEGLFLGSF